METRPTLRDIASRIGCTNATVSLALRGSPRISAATRQRVEQAAADLGYRPDPVLSALAAHRWHRRPAPQGTVLAAIGDRLEGFDGMEDRARSFGYRIETFLVADHPDPRRLSRTLYARGILGLLVGQVFTRGYCASFDWSPFVAVACSEGSERPPTHLVMPHHYRAVQNAWDRAWANGARRIGLLLFDIPSAMDLQDRRAAFLERQLPLPARSRIPILNLKPWSTHDPTVPTHAIPHSEAIHQLRDWMSAHRPDAILGFNGAFLWLLQQAGWTSPRDVRFYDLWVSQPTPQAQGYCLHRDEVGRRAVEWLDSLLRTGERGLPRHPVTMSVELQWQDGPGVR